MDLYTEARHILEVTQIIDRLEKYGDVELEGSYIYRTMVDRDIDMTLRLRRGEKMTFELRSKILADLGLIENAKAVQMSDAQRFPQFSSHAVPGVWYGVTPISETGNKWNIDIWAIEADAKTERDPELHQKLLVMDDTTRQTIVSLKQSALDRGEKQKGATSARIYDAVLNHHVSTYEGFKRYLQ